MMLLLVVIILMMFLVIMMTMMILFDGSSSVGKMGDSVAVVFADDIHTVAIEKFYHWAYRKINKLQN